MLSRRPSDHYQPALALAAAIVSDAACVWASACRQHGARRASEHLFRDAAEKQMRKSATSVSAHHNEVDFLLPCEVLDVACDRPDASFDRDAEPASFFRTQCILEPLPRFSQKPLSRFRGGRYVDFGLQKPVAFGSVTTCRSDRRAPNLSAMSLAHASAASDAGLKSVGTRMRVNLPAMAASFR